MKRSGMHRTLAVAESPARHGAARDWCIPLRFMHPTIFYDFPDTIGASRPRHAEASLDPPFPPLLYAVGYSAYQPNDATIETCAGRPIFPTIPRDAAMKDSAMPLTAPFRFVPYL